MPNRPIHIAVSTPLGAGYAAYKAKNQNGLSGSLEIIGGALGGFVGGVAPDCIDPPYCPSHRAVGHGSLPVAGVVNYWQRNLDAWQQNLRRMADQHRQHQAIATDPLAVAWHTIAEWALRLLPGILAGFGAGYLSHVVLDFGTPRCLPLIC